MQKRQLQFIVPAAVILVFLVLNIDFDGRLTLNDQLEQVRAALSSGESIPQIVNNEPLINTVEERVYDFFLRVRPIFGRSVVQRDDVLFMDVDDTAIVQVGDWPWSRDYMAKGLILLREFESDFVTFDIEYVEDSPLSVDRSYLTGQLPASIEDELNYLNDNFSAFVGALQQGQIPLDQADQVLPDLLSLSDDIARSLQADVAKVVQDNDQLLGLAAAFHGQAYFTVNILEPAKIVQPDPNTFRSLSTSQESRDLALAKAGVSVTNSGGELPRSGADILPAVPQAMSGAAGAGFPNVVVDDDGVRRRIDLFANVGDDYFAQLIAAPMLDLLQNPKIDIEDDKVTLSGAILPGETEPIDIEIPLSSDGRMLINWPNKTFLQSFRHETYYRLVHHWETEADIVANLQVMESYGFLDFYSSDFFGSGSELLNLYEYAQSLQSDVTAGGDRTQIGDWREFRQVFFDEVGQLVNGDTLSYLVDAYDAAMSDPDVPPELAAQYQDAKEFAVVIFDATQGLYEIIKENRDALMAAVPGSKIIIGWTGTSTTDIGVNPFEKEYVNVGTHAAVYNTILQQDFLDDTAWWVPITIAAGLTLLLAILLIFLDLSPAVSLIVGFGTAIFVVVGGVALFVTTGIYVNMVTPLASVVVTFIALTIIKFVRVSKDKNFIRNAFTHFLSNDVIKQIESTQELGLGGVKRDISAIFTDVKGFSTISEKLEPDKLVQLLNRYLSEMCDIILDLKGTIDKFEGDAIIAFFGAPIEMEDHAVRACRAAVEMHKLEDRLNKQFLEEGLSADPLLTRMGINSGEMVVGNMGTQNRMDYTMMGHNVNLAARLEGVNKQYGTWKLISEQTYNATKDEEKKIKNFTVRKLDRVRVVGIKEPVRLFELVDTREAVDGDKAHVQKLRTFNSGLTAFENKEWGAALKDFQVVLDGDSEDGPAKYYVDRCKAFTKKAPPANWDGVFDLQKK